MKLYESFTDKTSKEAKAALGGVFDAGGVEQVREVFETSEQPRSWVALQFYPGLRPELWLRVRRPLPLESLCGTGASEGGACRMRREEGA
ncbi:hypothetical protein [Candidatus Palauibacter sp.]|uniref:hypothetical protein n=1 Tax=Candidatus Palauibacter sp. TaxID=3101350 RepID=UPI003B523F9C